MQKDKKGKKHSVSWQKLNKETFFEILTHCADVAVVIWSNVTFFIAQSEIKAF